MEWDQEDPNMEVPAHEAPVKESEHHSNGIEQVRGIEEEAMPKGDEQGHSEFVELSPTQR
jgi:hypothetical protein